MKLVKRYFIYTEDFNAKGEFTFVLERPWRWSYGQQDEIFRSYEGYETEEEALAEIQEYYKLGGFLADGQSFIILPQYKAVSEFGDE